MIIAWSALILAILIGTLTPFQAGVNASLGKLVAHPLHATFVSFLGGLITVSIACLLTGKMFPTTAKLSTVPPHLLIGGLLGCIFVLTSIYVAPKLGATLFIACVLTGQLAASIVIDHFGWVGFAVHPISLARIVGILFLFTGVLLIKWF